jgi:hypothetical protein
MAICQNLGAFLALRARNQAIRSNLFAAQKVFPLLSFALFKNGLRAVFEHGGLPAPRRLRLYRH